jgi:GNAT superfamily N-acetyltransferase
LLEQLQLRASSHWPRNREWLAAHPDAVELPVEQIRLGLGRVAEDGSDVVGFSVLLPPANGACELDGLFVEPGRMGLGIGRRLVRDAAQIAVEQGVTRIDVVADPNSAGFYERMGFSGDERVPTRFGPAIRMRLPLGPDAVE